MLSVLLAAALLAPAGARAAVGHNFKTLLDEAPPQSRLSAPAAVAVDRSSGRVFVSDPGTGFIDVYDRSGTYLTRFGGSTLSAVGVAVDESTGYVYVADAFANGVIVFKPGGSTSYVLVSEWTGEALPSNEFGEVTGIAVDNSKGATGGDVYVVDAEDALAGAGVVDVFRPQPVGPEEGLEGELVRVLSKGRMEEPNGIAVDSTTGKVYVADSSKGAVFEYSPTGGLEGKLTGKGGPEGTFSGTEEEEGNVTGLALDPVSGDLLIAESERGVVAEFSAPGEWVGWITSSPAAQLGEPRGIAVSATGDVYLADTALARVDLFGPGATVPAASTAKATKLTRTTAALAGTVNGEGAPGDTFFEYGTSNAFGSSTPRAGFGSGEEKVSTNVTELHAGTLYFYRLVAGNENGTNYGATRQFETPTAVEGLSTGPVTSLEPTAATLNGGLAPNGVDAHYHFQWGKTAGYGNETPSEDAGAGTSPVATKVELTGLTPNTAYHYRLVASNSFGTTSGADQVFTTSGPPRITSKPVTGVGHETATLNGEVNPDELETSYHIEYGETTSYGSETPSGGATLGSGGKPVPVTAPLTGLKLGLTYHYRLIATNSAGTTSGPDHTFTTVPAALTTSYVTEVTPTTAMLGATVNPLGNATTYYFQYGTQPCATNPAACTDTPVAPGGDVGSGEAAVTESVALSELTPGTVYHYRVVALNVLGEAFGTEHSFTAPMPATPQPLPDGRAWEMVTPPDKGGAPVEALTREGGIILASETGDALTYVADGALGDEVAGNRSPEWQQVIARRGATAWTSQDIATPSSKAKGVAPGQAPEYQYFTSDLQTALVEPVGLKPEPPLAPGVTEATMYLRNPTGTFNPLVTTANTASGTHFGAQVHFVSATPDLTHVIITANVALTGEASAPGLYEWHAGQLALVSILPSGTPAHGLIELGYDHVPATAISTDGNRVVWTTSEENSHRGHLYLRDTATAQTVQLDAAQGVAEPAGTGTAQFQAASSDGSRVLFTDKQRLTADSTAQPTFPEKADLYECDLEETEGALRCRLRDLTVDQEEGGHAAVQNLIFGASSDLTSAYFIAQGVLAENENGSGGHATAGQDNLYRVWREGSQWQTTYIATLSGEDSAEWEGNRVADTAYLTARVSPNGRFLAFMSSASLTGYDNIDASPAAKGARDEEVFLYDSAQASLRCVSCNPNGARPAGVLDQNEAGEGLGLVVDRRKIWLGHYLAGNIPGWTAQSLVSALYQARYLSDEGRLYFNSPDELVPAATNHKEDVYEYEPSGVGSCASESGGCIALLSSGNASNESAFVEATPNGSDVFFVSAAQLLPQDTDTAFDIYGARHCTLGSPCLSLPKPSSPKCAEVETCRPAEAAQPITVDTGGSAGYTGAGNPPAPTPRQQVLGARISSPAKAKPPTRAQKLSRALRSCRRLHGVRRRRACEAHARKLFGPKRKKTIKASRK